MTTDELLTAWQQWLQDNPDGDVLAIMARMDRIAGEVRRPSAQPQRRKMFKRRDW